MKTRQALAAVAAALAATAGAQMPSLEAAEAAYARSVAACNNAGLPAPQREACVRAAGVELDRARQNQPPAAGLQTPPRVAPLPEAATPDGRATLIRQSGSAIQPQAASSAPPETRTTEDGRATIVVPSDSTLVRPGRN